MSIDPADSPEEVPERRSAARRHGRGRRAIDEFLEEVARILALPGKRIPTVTPFAVPPPPIVLPRGEEFADSQPSATRTRRHQRLWLPSLATFLLVAWGASFIPWSTGDRAIPVSFRGTWISPHADYEGRRLILTDTTVRVMATRYSIARSTAVRTATVRSTPIGPMLRLVFATGDGLDTLEMTLLAPGKLTLRHPADVIWERVENTRVSPSSGASVPEGRP